MAMMDSEWFLLLLAEVEHDRPKVNRIMTNRREAEELIDEILSEFSTEETLLENKVKELRSIRLSVTEGNQNRIGFPLGPETIEEAKEFAFRRNKELRRQLNISIGKQRSKQCYNPTEDNLDKMIEKSITYMSDIKQTRPRNGLRPYKRSPTGRFWCSSFRLNNNNIVTVQGIRDIVQQVFEIPENLTWIDLSFNKLTYIHAELSELRHLKILYLHGNLFAEFTPVLYHLQGLDKLYSLTLHGNPIEEVRGYRQRILSVLPNLKNLDFTNVTNADLECLDYSNGAGR